MTELIIADVIIAIVFHIVRTDTVTAEESSEFLALPWFWRHNKPKGREMKSDVLSRRQTTVTFHH